MLPFGLNCLLMSIKVVHGACLHQKCINYYVRTTVNVSCFNYVCTLKQLPITFIGFEQQLENTTLLFANLICLQGLVDNASDTTVFIAIVCHCCPAAKCRNVRSSITT